MTLADLTCAKKSSCKAAAGTTLSVREADFSMKVSIEAARWIIPDSLKRTSVVKLFLRWWAKLTVTRYEWGLLWGP